MLSYRRTVLKRRVIVNLTSGVAVEGILIRHSGPLLILKGATVHEPGAEPSPADGEIVIERSRIDYIQAL